MKRFFLIFSLAVVAALASASCSEKEDDPTPEPKYDVVSFESSEGLVDPIGGTVELGEAVLAGSLSGGTFQHLYWTKSFGGYESFLQNGRVVPFSQADALANELEKYGREYEFYALRRADHGSWQFWTPEMIDQVDAFIRRHLK